MLKEIRALEALAQVRQEEKERMNGSRVNEHRKRRVPATNWMVLIAILAAVFALGKVSTGQEYVPYVKDTGVVVERSDDGS